VQGVAAGRAGALVILLLLGAVPAAQRASSPLAVSARVVRSCRVATTGHADAPVRLTCSRDATPGVLTSVSPRIVRIPPSAPTPIVRGMTTEETTRAAEPPLPAATPVSREEPATDTPEATKPAIEIVTINF
jgi:hypothetical protein